MRMALTQHVSFLPFTDELKSYRFSTFRSDMWAALAVALLTIPQSIAYSLLAGLPPTAGLFSAIFGTILAASFGSSRHLVSGPSTGVAILIQTSIADVLYTYFPDHLGAEKELLALHILTQIMLLVGLIQIGAAFFNVSKLLQFVSRPVVLGYFAGIAVAILIGQLFSFFGVRAPVGDLPVLLKAVFFLTHMDQFHLATTAVGIFSYLLLLLLRRKWTSGPDALIMLLLGSLFAIGVDLWLGQGATPKLDGVGIPEDPLPALSLPLFDLFLINKVFPSAVAVSFLAILEVFSISRTFAAKSGHKVLVNQDIYGLGLGNLFLSFLFGAMPASGSITRTTLNDRMGAKTRIAAIGSGVLTAILLIFCWPLVAYIPLASVAALLIATVPSLIQGNEIGLTFKATREDAWVFLLTFGSCLLFSLDVAFFVGIVISIGTFLKKTSTPTLVEYAFNSKGRLMVVSPKEDVHRKVRIIGIGGDLYFATADVFQSALETVAQDPNVQVIVLRLNNVRHMDASMCLAILRLEETLKSSNRHLIISGLNEEVWHVFHRAGLVKTIGLDHLYFTDESNPQFSTWKACLRAQELIQRHRL
jgi:SulP family sulfate permease